HMTMKASEVIITPSKAMRDMIRDFYSDIKESKFKVIHHAFDKERFLNSNPLPSDVEKRLINIEPDTIKILYVSHLIPYKGYDVIIKAAKRLREWKMRFKFIVTMERVDWPEGYDLYPEAIIADGARGFVKWIAQKLTILMRWAYHSVDLMVDIGECMKKRLNTYHHNAHSATLVPWALVELDSIQKPDDVTRYELFNDAKLALLYSGNMGKAHDFSLILQLARRLYREDPKIVFCFACRGNRFRELAKAVRPDDYNIRFAPFAKEHEISKRLISADIHLLSLRPEWEGIVVPSKFFGSLAVGRPVLYTGPEGSAIYKWIQEFNIGMVLNQDNMEDVVSELLNIAKQPDKMRVWQENAFQAYKYFSKTYVVNQWDKVLQDLMKNKEVVLS
ncbi:hypothetical protein LCGC14_1362470, partial [marine sediment metagenome]